jgi:transposase
LIAKHPELARILHLLISIKGIAETSAIALMGELLLLPPDLSHRQWVKFAGLDPQAFESGKSVHKKTRLAKSGNAHITTRPTHQSLNQHLVDNGKLPLQAVCAVMRKLLHAIHGMLKHNQPFDNFRFYAIPVAEN